MDNFISDELFTEIYCKFGVKETAIQLNLKINTVRNRASRLRILDQSPDYPKIGDRFVRLIVEEIKFNYSKNCYLRPFIKCKCDCGNIYIPRSASYLFKGINKSCGCWRDEIQKEIGITKSHQMSKHSCYHNLKAMMYRCYNENHEAFNNYGGRGITICDEWNYNVVGVGVATKNFCNWADKNGYQKGLEIDRIDNNGNYEPSNCKWSTSMEQSHNKRTNIIIEYKGESKCVMEWSRDPRCVHKKSNTLYDRLRVGWDFEKALLTPVKQQRNSREANYKE